MLSPDWQDTLDTETPAQRLQASKELIQVQLAISKLSDASLADIAQQMNAQQADLQAATKGLDTALDDLTKFQTVVTAVANILNTVATIVPLI
jgi:predicted component of type VI protein secretion system